MSHLIYFNIWNGHFKMWGYDTFKDEKGNYRLITYFGKISDSLQKLQSREKLFNGLNPFWDCYDYVKAKIQDKLCKGYVTIENYRYSKYSCGKIQLSQFIKIIEKFGDKPFPNKVCEVV